MIDENSLVSKFISKWIRLECLYGANVFIGASIMLYINAFNDDISKDVKIASLVIFWLDVFVIVVVPILCGIVKGFFRSSANWNKHATIHDTILCLWFIVMFGVGLWNAISYWQMRVNEVDGVAAAGAIFISVMFNVSLMIELFIVFFDTKGDSVEYEPIEPEAYLK